MSLTVKQVADVFRVSEDTIRALDASGDLKPTTTNPRRYSEAAVRGFMARNQVNA